MSTIHSSVPSVLPSTNELENVLSCLVDDEIRTCVVNINIDVSGSMACWEKDIIRAIHETLTALINTNKNSEDVELRVRIKTFANKVTLFNTDPMKPEDLLAILTDQIFHCNGCTNLGAILASVDADYYRSSPLLKHLHTGDYKLFEVFITDMVGTDNEESRKASFNRLENNRLYKAACQTLVIFTGPDSKKESSVALAGGDEGCVIALNGDISEYLTPVLLEGTIGLTDATHVNMSGTTEKPADVAQNIIQRKAEGNADHTEIAKDSASLNAEIAQLLAV